MPPVERHISSSRERTGNGYRKLHEWIDDKNISPVERLARHSVFRMRKNITAVRSIFGVAAVSEYVRHLQEDYSGSFIIKVLLLGRIKKMSRVLVHVPDRVAEMKH